MTENNQQQTAPAPVQEQYPFPEVIDNTMRSAFIACEQKFFREFIQGYVPNGESIHLHAGQAFAAGVETALIAYHTHKCDPEDALMAGLVAFTKSWGDFTVNDPDATKTYERMFGAVVDYFIEYPLDQDHLVPLDTPHKTGVEFTFAIPIDIMHPVTGQPILYAGRFDRLAKWDNMIMISDDKTTSKLGASWANQWRLRAQFTGYVWAARKYGFDVAGFVIRGISILKHTYGHAQVIEQRPQWEVDRWYMQLLVDVQRMINAWKLGYWSYNLDKTCSDFSGCAFLESCSSPNPEAWLQVGFHKRIYSPLTNHVKPNPA